MKYRLKNKELQAKLEAIDPDFSVVMSYSCGNGGSDAYVILLPSKGVEMTIKISKSALEEAHTFDPKAWNKWPEVLPPKRGYYRVEYEKNNLTKKAAWMWDGLGWKIRPGTYFLLDSANKEGIRFKPWDDPDPDEDDDEEEE